MPAVKPLEKIPGLAPEAERATKEAINALVAEVQRLARLTRVTPLKTSSYSATEGDIVRVRGGVPVALPRARAENQGAQIHILVESLGGVRVTARDSTLNGITAANLTAVGMYEFESNGAGGWFSVVGAGGATNGITGATGAAGTAGSQGVKGDQGAPGQDGQDGADGPPGLNGIQGVKGDPGPPGQDGVDGQDGAPGPAGAAGTAGAPGATGSMGPPGMDGEKGDQGDPGPPGTSGGAGATPGWNSVLAVFPGSGANSPLVQAGQALLFDGGTAAGDIQVTNAFKLVTFGGNIALSTAFAAADITLNTVGGIAIQAGATPITAVTGSDIIMAADADIRFGAASGVNITAGSATAGAADPGDVAINATGGIVLASGIAVVTGTAVGLRLVGDLEVQIQSVSDGVCIDAGFASAAAAGVGDVNINGTSGIAIHAGAAQVTATTGIDITAEADITISAQGAGVGVGAGDILVQAATNSDIVVAGLNATMRNNLATSDLNATGAGVTLHTTGTSGTLINSTLVSLHSASGSGANFLLIGEAASSTVTAPAGDGMIWVQNTAPNALMFTDDVNQDWPVGYSAAGSSLVSTSFTTPAALNVAGTAGQTLATLATVANELPAGATFHFRGRAQVIRGATATATNVTLEFRIGGTQRFAIAAKALQTAASTHQLFLEGYFTIGAAPSAASLCTIEGYSVDDVVLAATIATVPTGTAGAPPMTAISGPTIATNGALTFDVRIFASVAVAGVTFALVTGFIHRIA